ncbi:sensor histidine kinase [Leptobacterium sp. I13]|uniref:sensor histidine kinase n=1 Tax=Leptobacterium meishanense TaxID=3128904 RepID=UPI0030EE0A0A
MKIDKKNYFFFLHALFWAITFWGTYNILATAKFYTMKMHPVKGKEIALETIHEPNYIYIILVDVLLKMIMVYGTLYILIPKFIPSKRYHHFVISAIVLFSITLMAGLFFEQFFSGKYIEQDLFKNSSRFLTNSIVFHIGIFSLALGYYFSVNWYKIEKQRQKLEKEKLVSELKFLKSQINPHFLFNTLNNIFAIARKYENPLLADSINKLAHLMRYMLYENDVEKVSLDREIKYLKDFIELQKLRLSNNQYNTIEFNESGNVNKYTIAPLLLIPFVENAFKYSISSTSKIEIKIALNIENETLIFTVENSVNYNNVNNHEDSGIGLKNVKRRLELIYPDKYNLEIKEQNKRYFVNLRLELDSEIIQ